MNRFTYQIRPNNHLLREAEDAEPAALKATVEHIARVSDHLVALENPEKNIHFKFILWNVLQDVSRGYYSSLAITGVDFMIILF